MKKLLVVGSLDDERNLRYLLDLKNLAGFNHCMVPWSALVLNSDAECNEDYDLVRIMSPWYEKNLRHIMKGADEDRPYDEQEKFLKLYVDRLRSALDEDNVLNSLDSIMTMRNKRDTQALLDGIGIRTPRTYDTETIEGVWYALGESTNVFVKPENASLGEDLGVIGHDKEGLWYASNHAGRRLVAYGEAAENLIGMKIADGGYLFQEQIVSDLYAGREYDLRCIYCIDEVIFSYARVRSEDMVGTNISQGAICSTGPLESMPKAKRDLIDDQVRHIADSLDYRIFAADVMMDENKEPVFLELNAFPGVKGPTELGVDIYMPEIMKINRILG